MSKQKIFLSCETGQLEACRDFLRSDLHAVGAEVVLQKDFQQGGGTLFEKLEGYIASCDRVIALVGSAYGLSSKHPPATPRDTNCRCDLLRSL